MCVSLSKLGSFCIPNFCHFIIANVFPPLFYASESPRLSTRTRILQDFSENPSLQLSLWPLVLIAATRYLICTSCIVPLSTTIKRCTLNVIGWMGDGWLYSSLVFYFQLLEDLEEQLNCTRFEEAAVVHKLNGMQKCSMTPGCTWSSVHRHEW